MANKSPAEIIGEKIKKFRMNLGDTQEAFADILSFLNKQR